MEWFCKKTRTDGMVLWEDRNRWNGSVGRQEPMEWFCGKTGTDEMVLCEDRSRWNGSVRRQEREGWWMYRVTQKKYSLQILIYQESRSTKQLNQLN
jgi:hypothetical protein